MGRTQSCIMLNMPLFLADVQFRFEAEALESAGSELRRLQEAARAVGFELRRGQVAPAPPEEEDDRRGTPYYPLTPRD
jgi:hypothetical protein